MMSPELARQHGMPIKPVRIFREFTDTASCIAPLVAYLASEEARTLEQEELNPAIPKLCCA
jgi:hypothetical protein